MRGEIKKASDAVEFETEERCFIKEVANDNGDELASIARARVAPGVTTAWHKLTNAAERYIIIQGQGRVQVGTGDPVAVTAGDVVRIPVGTPQRIENNGTVDLVFYAVCTPPFKSEGYVSLE